jgi:histidinol-phosphatase (PHP family)
MTDTARIPLDYHMHSTASCDSRATMAEMCRSALQRGIREIAFTEHFDPKPEDICAGYYQPDGYFAALDEARREFAPQGLTIRAGVELGEHHLYSDVHRPVLDAWPYDVALGSLHWVGDDSVFDADYFRAHSPRDAFEAYFTELAAMVRFGGFDVLAHADVIKRAAYPVYGHFAIAEWEALVREVWAACIDQGIGIEINTAALRQAVHEVHPGPESLRWYREMGGDILTIGSDSHRPDHVGYGLDVALDAARAAGFTRLASFERRAVARWLEI